MEILSAKIIASPPQGSFKDNENTITAQTSVQKAVKVLFEKFINDIEPILREMNISAEDREHVISRWNALKNNDTVDWLVQRSLDKLRPGRSSGAGFCGKNEDIIRTIHEDRVVLNRLGLSSDKFASILHRIIKDQDDMLLACGATLGYQEDPFLGSYKTDSHYNIEGELESILVSGLMPTLIRQFDFFEGKDSEFRIEPLYFVLNFWEYFEKEVVLSRDEVQALYNRQIEADKKRKDLEHLYDNDYVKLYGKNISEFIVLVKKGISKENVRLIFKAVEMKKMNKEDFIKIKNIALQLKKELLMEIDNIDESSEITRTASFTLRSNGGVARITAEGEARLGEVLRMKNAKVLDQFIANIWFSDAEDVDQLIQAENVVYSFRKKAASNEVIVTSYSGNKVYEKQKIQTYILLLDIILNPENISQRDIQDDPFDNSLSMYVRSAYSWFAEP